MNWLPIFPGETLDPQAFELALKLIRQGAFPESAFLAAGLSPKAFSRLVGSQNEADQERYRLVLQAVGMARSQAEINAHKEITRSWLINGPGALIRELPRWGSKAEPQEEKYEWLAALGELHRELRDAPAAQAHILRALHKLNPDALFGAPPPELPQEPH